MGVLCLIFLLIILISFIGNAPMSKKSTVAKAIRSDFESQYCLSDAEDKALESRILDKSNWQEIYKILSPDLVYIWGENWHTVFDFEKQKRNTSFWYAGDIKRIHPVYYYAKLLLLAHDGKVDRSIVDHGISLGVIGYDEVVRFAHRLELIYNSRGIKVKFVIPNIRFKNYHTEPDYKYYRHRLVIASLSSSSIFQMVRLWNDNAKPNN